MPADRATVKSGVAVPGSRAPVLLASVIGTTMTSPSWSGRASETVSVAVSEASPSRIVVSELVSSTAVCSSSVINATSEGSVVDTV